MRVGAVDIGTNTARLLIADVAQGITWVERRVRVTGLGVGVDARRRFDPAAVDRTVATLAGYGALLRHHQVGTVAAVATSATRDAADRDSFLDRAGLALATRVRVIAGEEEAALSFRGAVHDLAAPAPYLVIDVGGGSTEFVLGTDRPEYAVSVDIGSVRLTDRCLPGPPVPAEARPAFAGVELPQAPGTVVAVGGTYTALAAITLDQQEYVPAEVHLSELTADALEELVARLGAMTIPETAAIPSLDPARAPVLLGGAIVAREALRAAGASGAVVSENDLLMGLVLSVVE